MLHFLAFFSCIMKSWAIVVKVLKYFLWVVLVWILSLLVIGFAKFDGGVSDYFHYLNEKDMSSSWEQVHIFSPSTYGALFWEAKWDALDAEVAADLSKEAEELEIEGLNMDEEMESDIDVFDPEFEEEFENFFNDEELDDMSEYESDDEFGFVSADGSGDIEGDVQVQNLNDENVEANAEEEWLSDNKKSLLKLFKRN